MGAFGHFSPKPSRGWGTALVPQSGGGSSSGSFRELDIDVHMVRYDIDRYLIKVSLRKCVSIYIYIYIWLYIYVNIVALA